LYFDFRATGRSGGFFSTGGARETRDIDAAAAFVQGRLPGGAVGLFGFSMGGAAVLLSANPAVKARALDAPFADLHGELEHIFAGWGHLRRPLLLLMRGWMLLFTGVDIKAVSPVRNAAAFAAPMLLVHGTLDGTVPPANSAALKAANPAAELWLVEGADHGQNHYTAPAEYERRLTAFFRGSL
ncbi:MAG TPA: alpha/beta hydrolase, partial [Elusimicrobia bacterium]|nr:alpha/beta hydrolase [Elusimicrobiota bacterium]